MTYCTEDTAVRIRIGDREYPVVTPRGSNGQLRGGMNLQALFDLRRQSPEVFGFEVGLAKLDDLAERAREARAARLAAQRAGDAASVRAADASVVDDGLVNIAILVFLSRRAAGDRCTLAEAADVDLDELEWIREPGDPDDAGELEAHEESPDPTLPGPASPETPGAVRKGSGKGGSSSRGRGTTSKRRSGNG